jgi:hypothetical protein
MAVFWCLRDSGFTSTFSWRFTTIPNRSNCLLGIVYFWVIHVIP